MDNCGHLVIVAEQRIMRCLLSMRRGHGVDRAACFQCAVSALPNGTLTNSASATNWLTTRWCGYDYTNSKTYTEHLQQPVQSSNSWEHPLYLHSQTKKEKEGDKRRKDISWIMQNAERKQKCLEE